MICPLINELPLLLPDLDFPLDELWIHIGLRTSQAFVELQISVAVLTDYGCFIHFVSILTDLILA